MQFIKDNTSINFLEKRKLAISISILLILVGAISLAMKKGPKLGIDFTGGTILQVKFKSPTKIQEIRQALKKLELGETDIQEFGSPDDFLIRLENKNDKLGDIGAKVKEALESIFGKDKIIIERVEAVGPKVGSDLRQKALFAMYYAILFIAVYISGRFELKWVVSIIMAAALIATMQILLNFIPNLSVTILIFAALIITLGFCVYLKLKFALAAILALIHDVLITVTAFSLFDKEFTLPVIAALLTIIGYSLNDTIVIFDRIRENFRKSSKKAYSETINKSINQSLNRTILTSLTTLLMVSSLLILGGEVIHDFSFALFIGIIVGTYSSIFIASPILVIWTDSK